MKTVLHMAISADGYVAREDGDTRWISEIDASLFETRAREAGCIIVGRKTFDQYHGELYPLPGTTTIVLSRIPKETEEESVYYATSVTEAFALAQELNHDRVLVAGGGNVSGACLREGVIDELFLTVHPLILGSGIQLFDDVKKEVSLTLLGSESLEEGVVQLHYATHA